MNMEYLVVAILSEMSSIHEDLIVDSKKGGARYKYYMGKLEGLKFALERTQDTEREVEILTKHYSGILRRNAHQLDIDTRVQFKKLISQAIHEYERSA